MTGFRWRLKKIKYRKICQKTKPCNRECFWGEKAKMFQSVSKRIWNFFFSFQRSSQKASGRTNFSIFSTLKAQKRIEIYSSGENEFQFWSIRRENRIEVLASRFSGSDCSIATIPACSPVSEKLSVDARKFVVWIQPRIGVLSNHLQTLDLGSVVYNLFKIMLMVSECKPFRMRIFQVIIGRTPASGATSLFTESVLLV